MIISEKPWECPRCRKINAPNCPQCFCTPVKREYCSECFSDSVVMFNSPLPSLDILEAYAECFHKNYTHSGCNDNQSEELKVIE